MEAQPQTLFPIGFFFMIKTTCEGRRLLGGHRCTRPLRLRTFLLFVWVEIENCYDQW